MKQKCAWHWHAPVSLWRDTRGGKAQPFSPNFVRGKKFCLLSGVLVCKCLCLVKVSAPACPSYGKEVEGESLRKKMKFETDGHVL